MASALIILIYSKKIYTESLAVDSHRNCYGQFSCGCALNFLFSV